MNPIYFDLLLFQSGCFIQLSSFEYAYQDKQNQSCRLSIELLKIELDPDDKEIPAQYFYLQLDSSHIVNNELRVFEQETMAKKYFEDKKRYYL